VGLIVTAQLLSHHRKGILILFLPGKNDGGRNVTQLLLYREILDLKIIECNGYRIVNGHPFVVKPDGAAFFAVEHHTVAAVDIIPEQGIVLDVVLIESRFGHGHLVHFVILAVPVKGTLKTQGNTIIVRIAAIPFKQGQFQGQGLHTPLFRNAVRLDKMGDNMIVQNRLGHGMPRQKLIDGLVSRNEIGVYLHRLKDGIILELLQSIHKEGNLLILFKDLPNILVSGLRHHIVMLVPNIGATSGYQEDDQDDETGNIFHFHII